MTISTVCFWKVANLLTLHFLLEPVAAGHFRYQRIVTVVRCSHTSELIPPLQGAIRGDESTISTGIRYVIIFVCYNSLLSIRDPELHCQFPQCLQFFIVRVQLGRYF